MFELNGPVAEFDIAAQALGLESMLGDRDKSLVAANEDESTPSERQAFLYVTMPNEEGLDRLIAMWNRYKKGREAFGPSESRFWAMFGYLNDLRTWSAQDRVDPSMQRYISAMLDQDDDSIINVEFDLWYRSERQKLDGAVSTLERLVKETGGNILDFVEIPEIRYQGVLVAIKVSIARQIMTHEGKLSNFDGAMTIRPQAAYLSDSNPPAEGIAFDRTAAAPSKPCVTALLDGYPVTQHIALAGRVNVHEVEIGGAQVPLTSRDHGTSMASLIVNGDLFLKNEAPLTRPVLAVPILTTTANGREGTPPGKLAIGVVYRAINSVIDAGQKDEELARIVVFNHSLCDTNFPFVRKPSPWATLLDYFSHHHRLLFVVSAGNIFSSIPVHDFANYAAFQAASPAAREAAILNAVEQFKANRGIFSPAESVNSLTVGALHVDGSMNPPVGAVDPYPTLGMTNLASAIGLGVNRSIKPDLVDHGGRFAALCSNHPDGYLEVSPNLAGDMGNLTAAPSHAGDLTYTRRGAGTSNATALVTRACNQIADALDDLYRADKIDWTSLPTRAPILKALATHGCNWGDIGRLLEEVYPPQDSRQWSRRRNTISKFIGFGKMQLNRVLSGEDNRITLLAEESVTHDELHEYRIPMPSSLFNTRELRSVTMTLAWTAPVVVTTVDYRGVVLKLVDESGKRDYWDGVGRILQPNADTAERGTLFHVRLEGTTLRKHILPNGLFVGVQARSTHKLHEFAKVPYALVITLEMAQLQNATLYEDVRSEIESRASARTTTRIGGR